VYPCGVPTPAASNLNYQPGVNVPNAVLTKVGDGGKVCLFTLSPLDLIVDVNGSFAAGSGFVPLVPARLLDSRSVDGKTTDGVSARIGLRAAGSVTEVKVTGRGGVPEGAGAVSLNVTAVGAQAKGFVTVYPCGVETPAASNLNYQPGVNVPNAVLTKVGDGGKVCLFTLSPLDLIVDVNGSFE